MSTQLAYFVIFTLLNQYVLSITHELDGEFGHERSFNVSDNQTISISYKSNSTDLMSPPRLFVKLPEDSSNILTVFVKYTGGSESWQLPFNEKNGKKLFAIAHTLWTPIENNHNTTNNSKNTSKIIVNLSTSSEEPIYFSIQLSNVQNFNVPLDQEENFAVTLSQPVIRYFEFKRNENIVLITVNTDSKNSCMTFSIQNSSDTVFDTLSKVSYRGLRQTVTTKGAIIVSKEEYPIGLLLVFIVHSSYELCNGSVSLQKNNYFNDESNIITKNITLKILKTVNFNILSYASGIALISVCWVLIFSTLLVYYLLKKNVSNTKKRKKKKNADSAGPSTTVSNVNSIEDYYSNSSEDNTASKIRSEDPKNKRKLLNEFKRLKSLLFVSDLSLKNHKYINAKSKLYLWNLITVAIFYSLPVIQLVFSFQKVVNDYGNQDLCYYNFFCSHSLIIGNIKFIDFNHILSNIGYILFGFLFIIIVRLRELGHSPKKNFGTPRHTGLYYSMGAALAFEGLMSACYHVCPNATNFQFDTSFMYIICIICMVKIYQTRHPDINASAYFIYVILAFVIIIGLLGIYAQNSLVFNVFFFIIHLTVCIWLSTHIYYVGLWKYDKKTLTQFYEHIKCSPRPHMPRFKDRIILLSIGLIINIILAAINFINPHVFENFPSYLLTLFMANLILYLFFYLLMKWISKECMHFESYQMYLIIAIACWGASLFFYSRRTSVWNFSPAQSRELNAKCALFDLFDYHDIWHILSAISLFFSFMVLFTMDDNLNNSRTSSIIVF